jgi:hypothetical protein
LMISLKGVVLMIRNEILMELNTRNVRRVIPWRPSLVICYLGDVIIQKS